MLQRHAEVNVFLPFSEKDFLEQSVNFGGSKWIKLFEKIKPQVNIKYVTKEDFLKDKILFGFGGTIFQGYGRLRAIREESEPELLSLWDKVPSNLPGGTAHIIKKWSTPENHTSIDINPLLKARNIKPSKTKGGKTKPNNKPNTSSKNSPRLIRNMLFSDIVGFSKLEERHYPNFVHDFLQKISKKIEPFRPKPVFINTWGDAIFAAMPEDNVIAMAEYAFKLLDAVDKASVGKLSQLNIRIALHAGPVYLEKDPITNRDNYYGCHVNRAARLEPATPPGRIYVSEQFAALLTVHQSAKSKTKNKSAKQFTCKYIGDLDLVKGFGGQTVYELVKK